MRAACELAIAWLLVVGSEKRAFPLWCERVASIFAVARVLS